MKTANEELLFYFPFHYFLVCITPLNGLLLHNSSYIERQFNTFYAITVSIWNTINEYRPIQQTFNSNGI